MLIYNEKGEKVDTEKLEHYEQYLANKYVNANDIVLELGARYGSVSCVINKKLLHKKNHIAVEPDERVWTALDFNKTINDCEFQIIRGFISDIKLDLVNKDCWFGGYGSTSVWSEHSKIPNYPLQYVREKYLPEFASFTCLVADCEGGLERFLDENQKLYYELRTIIYEADYPEKCDYQKIEDELTKHGFVAMEKGFQNVWIKPNPPILSHS
jgi:hypothetical protein